MGYGKDKIRDMVRSLLPSTARKGARDMKQFRSRKLRRKSRLVCKAMLDFDGPLEDLEQIDAPTELDGWDNHISTIVAQRRASDKVAPFVRWAAAITVTLETYEDKMSFMKSIVPDNIIGFHALTHVETMFQDRSWNYGYAARLNFSNRDYLPEDGMLRSALVFFVLDGRLHRGVNSAIKKAHWDRAPWDLRERVIGLNPRVLLGIHDVDDFIHDITHLQKDEAWDSVHFEWPRAVRDFVWTWIDSK